MPKRGENIRKRKDGRCEARVLIDKGQHKSIYAQSYSELKIKVKQSECVSPKIESLDLLNITFEKLSEEWLNEKIIKDKQSTISIYRGIIKRHIQPYFKSKNLTDIGRNDINQFIKYKSYDVKLSPKTVKDIIAVLIQILKYAERQNYISPISYDIARPKIVKKELEILTLQEQAILTSRIKKDIHCENIGVLLSLFIGLRLGEVCALQWKDIDFKSGIINITKTMQRISSQDKEQKTRIIIDTPKSQKSQRKIPIPDFLFFELKRLSLNCSEEAYILTGSENRYIEPRAYQNKFKKILKESGIRNTNYHALRHTFATRAIEQSIDVKTLSEILGHSTVNFTLERYVHPSITMKKQSIEKLAVCY